MPRTLPALVGLALVAAPVEAQVGLVSSVRTVALTATRHGSVSVSLPAERSPAFPGSLEVGLDDFPPVRVATAWNLDPERTASVSLVAYFDLPAAVLANGAAAISSVAGGTLALFSQPVSREGARGSRTDDLPLRIDLSGWTELPAGQYQGTLSLQAITQ